MMLPEVVFKERIFKIIQELDKESSLNYFQQ